MEEKRIVVEMPLDVVESLFSALQRVRPQANTRLENKAVSLFKEQVFFALEQYIEPPEEKEHRQMKFFQMFAQEREKRRQENIERAGDSYY